LPVKQNIQLLLQEVESNGSSSSSIVVGGCLMFVIHMIWLNVLGCAASSSSGTLAKHPNHWHALKWQHKEGHQHCELYHVAQILAQSAGCAAVDSTSEVAQQLLQAVVMDAAHIATFNM
jgi:hypothetical protein